MIIDYQNVYSKERFRHTSQSSFSKKNLDKN